MGVTIAALASGAALVLGLALAPIGALQAGDDANGDGVITCDDFTTRAEARAAIDDDPALAETLDPDADGVPCDELPDSGGVGEQEPDDDPDSGTPGPVPTKAPLPTLEPEQPGSPTPTAEPTEPPTATPSPTPDPTATPVPTAKPSPTATATATATPSPTPTPNATPTPTATAPTVTPPPASAEQEASPEPTRSVQPTAVVLPVCAEFSNQRRAQRELDRNPAAAVTLDPEGTGIACGAEFGTPEPTAVQPTSTPTPVPPAPTPTPTSGPLPSAPALPQIPDIDCVDLGYQEVAQAILDRDPTDPFNLDPNGDGIACSSLPSRGSRPPSVTELPDTGSGPLHEATRVQR